MNTFALFSEEVSASYSLSEKLETILTTAVGGYLLVFLVLALIWGILEIFNLAFGKKKKDSAAAGKPTTPPAPTPIPVAVEEPLAEPSHEEEIVAAIAAAIAAYTQKPLGSFRVVSFRKKK